ncbi:hypothetical protein BGX24_009371 [Mortierella sp. AD032]|nr:hypothetical protein BGX24_009371 [Mortierella sp. AD032]
MYREHEPFICSVDVNRTRYDQLDVDLEGPKRVTDYTISGDGSHVLVTTVTEDHRFLQLWTFKEPSPVVPSRFSKGSNYSQQPSHSKGSTLSKPCSRCLSPGCSYQEATKLHTIACIDLSGLDGGSDKKEKVEEYRVEEENSIPVENQNATAFYKVNINCAEVPAGVADGSGFKRFNPEEQCPILKGLSAKAAFHIIATQKQDVKDELFVTCDGITIEVYSAFEEWSHLRSVVMKPTLDTPVFASNVSNALRNNLCSIYLPMRDRDAHQVSTWDIKQGIRRSSYTNLTYEQMENVNECATVSKDGSLIAIPGKHQVDIFLIATWTLATKYTFRDMEHSPSTRSVQFIRNEEIMVALDYEHQPFYKRNRGCILGAKRDSLVEEYMTEGCDTFWTPFNNPTSPRTICIGVSQSSLFNLEDRTEVEFMTGIAYLHQIFGISNDVLQQKIIQYISKYINYSRSGATSHGDVVLYVCDKWTPDTHRSTVQLWKTLLALPTGRWIPRHDMARDTNPLLRLLNKTKDNPDAIELAEVFINYCVLQAKIEKDTLFLLPIFQCLQELMDPKQSYAEATLMLLRDLAYLPTRDREAIMKQHWIAHPFEPHWRFWTTNPEGLDQYKDQVLNVTSAHIVNRPENNFSREIYFATFDMLWLRSNPDPKTSVVPDPFRKTGQYFLRIIDRITSDPTPRYPTVKCHSFGLEALDNPAIAALVEYKWNTIGLQYWLIRFLIQCVYYALVFAVVLMHIYRDDEESNMRNIFGAIALMAFSFLWIEFTQFVNDMHGYFLTVYNYVDLLAFLVPFVASILQLCSPDFSERNTVSSYSILFIFLHFGFSYNFLRALSMTYFMLSARYDAVSNGLRNNDFSIHIMLVIFSFLTVIIMTNVLIGLINNAYDYGDRTWELDWLRCRMRYVENAEITSYQIPAFRESRNYFPDTIYYTATTPQAFGRRQDMQLQLQEQEQEEVDANAGENRAIMEMFKQFQEELRLMRKEQIEVARLEQQEVYKAVLMVHEEQKRVAEELRKELAHLRKQRQQ